MINKKISWKWVIILLVSVLISISSLLYFYDSKPSLVQDQFRASTEDKFVYEMGSSDEAKTISDDSTYYELRTRYDNIRITDIGTQHEIDSIRPIRAKQVVELWKEYKKLD